MELKALRFGSEKSTLETDKNGKLFEQVHHYMFIGILVEDKLSFNQHTHSGNLTQEFE